jgi:hypothetical protein
MTSRRHDQTACSRGHGQPDTTASSSSTRPPQIATGGPADSTPTRTSTGCTVNMGGSRSWCRAGSVHAGRDQRCSHYRSRLPATGLHSGQDDRSAPARPAALAEAPDGQHRGPVATAAFPTGPIHPGRDHVIATAGVPGILRPEHMRPEWSWAACATGRKLLPDVDERAKRRGDHAARRRCGPTTIAIFLPNSWRAERNREATMSAPGLVPGPLVRLPQARPLPCAG